MRQMHEELGNFGIRMIHSMLRGQYWWTGMYQQVTAYVKKCEICDRVRSSFNTLLPQLQPFLIMRLGYHWLLRHMEQRYMLVIVEHFNKWIELVALPQNSAKLAAAVFLDRVLARFGVLT